MNRSRHETIVNGIGKAPFAVSRGLKIESAEGGAARVRMPFAEANLNAGGLQAPIHGGAIAALIDVAACAAIWTLPQTQRSATVSLTVNYLAAASGCDLVAEARVRHAGRSLASLAVEVHGAGVLVAEGLVTYKLA